MSVEAFLDTNILVYAAAGGEGEDVKQQQALRLIADYNFGLSAQVLQEFYVTVVRKIDEPLRPVEALEWIEQLEVFPCQPIEPSLIKIGVEISQRYQISYWDGAVIAAAEALGAETLFTEDLSHDQKYGSVRVVNPFFEY